jgi:uncharacterized membrane protein
MPGRQHRLEIAIKRLLLAGSWFSTVLLTLGLVTFLLGVPVARDVLRLGLFVLMITPVMRVIMSAAQYLRERDWLFALVTLAVLAVLTGTLAVALRIAQG